MKNEMREDLLITRKDFYMHFCTPDVQPDEEEETPLPLTVPACSFWGLLRWMLKRED